MNLTTQVANVFRQNSLLRLYKHYIFDSVIILKNEGWKVLIRKRGTKFLFIIFGYYLIRDTILYIIIPLCIAKGLL